MGKGKIRQLGNDIFARSLYQHENEMRKELFSEYDNQKLIFHNIKIEMNQLNDSVKKALNEHRACDDDIYEIFIFLEYSSDKNKRTSSYTVSKRTFCHVNESQLCKIDNLKDIEDKLLDFIIQIYRNWENGQPTIQELINNWHIEERETYKLYFWNNENQFKYIWSKDAERLANLLGHHNGDIRVLYYDTNVHFEREAYDFEIAKFFMKNYGKGKFLPLQKAIEIEKEVDKFKDEVREWMKERV